MRPSALGTPAWTPSTHVHEVQDIMQVVVADSSVDTGQAEQVLVARFCALQFVLQELGLPLRNTTQTGSSTWVRWPAPHLWLSMEPSPPHPHILSPCGQLCLKSHRPLKQQGLEVPTCSPIPPHPAVHKPSCLRIATLVATQLLPA